jgi:hypothetical protein
MAQIGIPISLNYLGLELLSAQVQINDMTLTKLTMKGNDIKGIAFLDPGSDNYGITITPLCLQKSHS